MPPDELRPLLEALLFASDSPLTLSLLVETTGADAMDVAHALEALREDLDRQERGVQLVEIGGGWLIVTREKHAPWIKKMLQGKRKARLSRAALETLAIVAYKQPVTRPEIESIRGVDSGSALATLLERDLITIKGRSDVVGRPLLYGSTSEFLSYFGLRDLNDLPRPEELKAILQAREAEAEPEPLFPVSAAQAEATAEAPKPALEPPAEESSEAEAEEHAETES
jgi:segregation and condensation protein B